MRVIDLGGEAQVWLDARVRPAEVTLLNLEWKVPGESGVIEAAGASGWMKVVGGDACGPPDELLADGYDLAYSNSVIEHLGGHARRAAFARAVASLAPHHWIQTPNRYFPVEPHLLCPGFQFLPVSTRVAIAKRWPLGAYEGFENVSEERIVAEVLSIELLSLAEMRFYFPDSEILSERVGPLTKSFVAVG
jgi:hypothetical protein